MFFAGYLDFPAQFNDPLRSKWAKVYPEINSSTVRVSAALPDFTPTSDGIAAMNTAVNSPDTVRYQSEPPGQDYWQTPAETLALQTGDCEDFAILKYAALLAAGIDDSSLRLMIGQIKSIAGNRDHAWLAAYVDGAWNVLDCLFDKVITPADYINWLPLAMCWGPSNVSRFGPEVTLSNTGTADGTTAGSSDT